MGILVTSRPSRHCNAWKWKYDYGMLRRYYGGSQ